ncbi:MAG: bifunctional heptose 7-phosphate kinase/heptose 1-phosphate adenyltransferase [Terriglobales bacterium]
MSPAPTNPAGVRTALRLLRGRRVAVIGDTMLDVFLWGDADRISPEAPVPVVHLRRQSFALGGAANVAANVAGLGGHPVLFSALGADAAGERLRHLLPRQGIEVGALLAIPGRQTSTKIRILARNKHMLRCDRESTLPISAAATREILTRLAAQPRLGAVVISDYAKGCVTGEMVRGVARYCAHRGLPWCVDPKQPELQYRGASVLKPNRREMEAMTGLAVESLSTFRRAALRLLRRHRCQHLLVTLGAQGLAWVNAAGDERRFPAHNRQVTDVTGAGDTVSAVVGLGLAARLPLPAIARLANLAGAYVVSQPGLAIATPSTLLSQID